MSSLPSIFVILLLVFVVGCVLFFSAGRIDLPWFWALLGTHLAVMVTGLFLMDPELRRERIRPGPGGKDRLMPRIAKPFLLAHWIVAGLDAGRFEWTGPIPFAVHATGLGGYLAGMALVLWAVSVNRFFSPVVRIQSERGHTLITTGPYRCIRHPGYLGAILGAASGALALGSYWSLVPLLPVLVLILRRVLVEDRFLHENLPGYREYAARVRSRLIPWVW